MKRIYVKAGLANLSVAKKIVLGNAVAGGLTNNPLIPNAVQMQQDVLMATQNLTTAAATAKTGTHADEQALLLSEIEFNRVMNTAMWFVQGIADTAGSTEFAKEIILSSGFGARKTPEKSPTPEQVIKVMAMATNVPGEILLSWKGSKYSKCYIILHSLTPTDGNSWVQVATTSRNKKKYIFTDLSFAAHFYKVVAVGVWENAQPSNTVAGVCLPM